MRMIQWTTMLTLLVGLFVTACALAQPAPDKNAPATAAPADNLPVLNVQTVARPVVTSRCFSWGMAPNVGGGWTVVAQFMNFKSTGSKEKVTIQMPNGQHYLAYKDTTERPEAEWVIGDLQKNTFKLVTWPGFHAGATALAGNGRLFFALDYAHIYYYEPAEDTVKPLGRVWDDMLELRNFYKLVVGPDGMIYGSGVGTTGLTSLIRINPDTLEYTLYRKIGLPGRRKDLTYGYSLAVDPPWMYVAVGQGNWELFAVNADTGAIQCLADVQGEGCRVTVDDGGDFCMASVGGSDGKRTRYVLLDGKAQPLGADQKPSGTPRSRKTYRTVSWKNTKPMDISKPPELDPDRPLEVGGADSAGNCYWRPAKSAGDWRSLRFAIKNTEPVGIESLLALPDGSLLGNAGQYNGFFRYYPATRKLDYFGKHGPSGIKSVLYEGKAWFCGYPNVNLSVYDPAQAWTSTKATRLPAGAAPVNPKFIEYFGSTVTEAHHCHFLLAPGNGRIYICGQRERWSTGTGLGYYDIAANKQFGLGQANKEFDPVGFIALPKLNRLVLSGRGKTQGKLIVYDMDLKEVERVTLQENLSDTGALSNADSDSAFIGCYQDPASKAWTLYLYDLSARKMLKSVTLDKPGYIVKRPVDNSFWFIADGTLARFNPQTLAIAPVVKLDRGFGQPTWVGKELYGRAGGELVKLASPLP